jgi:putrescine transport system permease protein
MAARSSPSQPRWQIAALLLGFAFFYIPIAWIVLFSCNDGRTGGVFTSFSLRWYAAFFENTTFRSAALQSLVLAAASSTVAAVLGTLSAFALVRLGLFRGKGLLIALLAVPIFVPEILIAFAFLMLFVGLEAVTGWPDGRGLTTLVIGHATLGMAFVASIVAARLQGFDKSLEEAALDLGARPLRVFLTVTAPLALPGIAAGWLLAFTLSFDDLITSSFLAGPADTTLPMLVYSTVRLGVDPQVNVVGTLLIGAVTLVLASVFLLNNRSAQRQTGNAYKERSGNINSGDKVYH